MRMLQKERIVHDSLVQLTTSDEQATRILLVGVTADPYPVWGDSCASHCRRPGPLGQPQFLRSNRRVPSAIPGKKNVVILHRDAGDEVLSIRRESQSPKIHRPDQMLFGQFPWSVATN